MKMVCVWFIRLCYEHGVCWVYYGWIRNTVCIRFILLSIVGIESRTMRD